LKKIKVVITGGSGNLGQSVVRSMSESGFEVLNLDTVRPTKNICESWVMDLNQTEDLYKAFEGAGAVIHLAAYQSPFMAADTEVFRNNITGTYNVFKAGMDVGVSKIVHASSVAAYGFTYAPKMWNPDYLPLDENHPLKPRDPYAFSKVFGEQIADSYVSMCALSAVSLRLAGVNFDLSYQSLPERWDDPGDRIGTFWSYVDVRDAAEACRLAVETQISGHEIFNIAAAKSRYPVPTSDLVDKYLPETKIKDGMSGCWSGLDSSKARSLLGYKDRHVWEDYITADGTQINK